MKKERKQKEREARKKDILDTALKLFAEKDYHEVTVDEIAEDVGLSKGTLYLYFENKENLFISILTEKTNELYSRVEAAIHSEAGYLERLTGYCENFLQFFEEHGCFFKIVHSEKSRGYLESRDKMHSLMKESYKRFDDLLQSFIKEGQELGFFRELDAGALVRALRGSLNQAVFTEIFNGNGSQITQRLSEILDIFLNGARVKSN